MSILKDKLFLSLFVMIGGIFFQAKSETVTFYVDPVFSKNKNVLVSKDLSFSFATEYIILPTLNNDVKIDDIEFMFAYADSNKNIIDAVFVNHDSKDFLSEDVTIGDMSVYGDDEHSNLYIVRKHGSSFLPSGYSLSQAKEEESDSDHSSKFSILGKEVSLSKHLLGKDGHGLPPVSLEKEVSLSKHLLGKDGHGLPPVSLEKEESMVFSLVKKVIGKNVGIWNAVVVHGKKFIAVGMGDSVHDGKDFFVGKIACFNADGTLDTSFGDKGMVETDLAGVWHSVVIDKDKIIVAGNKGSHIIEKDEAIVECYTLDGKRDETFGIDDCFIEDARVGRFNDFVVTPDNKIILVGYDKKTENPIMTRYTLKGNVDTTFGENGYVLFDKKGYWNRVVIDEKNKRIIVGGTQNNEKGKADKALIAFYNFENGKRDTRLMKLGYFYPNMYMEEMLQKIKSQFVFLREIYDFVLFENNLYVAGSISNGNVVIIRYDEKGVLDKTFGEDKTGGIEMVGSKSEGSTTLGFELYGNKLFFAANAYVLGLSLDGRFESKYGGKKGYCFDSEEKCTIASLAVNDNNVMVIGGQEGSKMALYFVDIKK